ncbi:MAG: hypothetical protein ACK5OC_09895, partial [Pirellula sp.]
ANSRSIIEMLIRGRYSCSCPKGLLVVSVTGLSRSRGCHTDNIQKDYDLSFLASQTFHYYGTMP